MDSLTLIASSSQLADAQCAAAYGRIGLPAITARTSLLEVLHLLGHAPTSPASIPARVFTTRRVHRGHSLLLSGQPLENLHLVLSGSFKSILNEVDGTQQIVAFPMRGDLIGLDAFGTERHPVTVTALEESHVVVLPRRELTELAAACGDLDVALRRAGGAELLRNYQAMRTMGALGAEARLARFLFELGQRLARFGLSARVFRLPMTRADIASYLGLSIETVSRAFTSLATRHIIDVDRNSVNIVQRERLRQTEDFTPHSLQVRIHDHAQGRQAVEPALN